MVGVESWVMFLLGWIEVGFEGEQGCEVEFEKLQGYLVEKV